MNRKTEDRINKVVDWSLLVIALSSLACVLYAISGVIL